MRQPVGGHAWDDGYECLLRVGEGATASAAALFAPTRGARYFAAADAVQGRAERVTPHGVRRSGRSMDALLA